MDVFFFVILHAVVYSLLILFLSQEKEAFWQRFEVSFLKESFVGESSTGSFN